MFPIYINDGTQEVPKDDIFYVIAKEGIYLRKKLGIMQSIAPVKNISILQSIDEMHEVVQMFIPKIPAVLFSKILQFFKEVYDEHKSECIVLIFYNEETKKFHIEAPKQTVGGASLNYNRLISIDGYIMIGTIHSHASMSAFHSGVDDADEKTFDGLHITIGDLDETEVSISSSIVANGHRFMVESLDYISGITLTKDIDQKETEFSTKIYQYINGKLELDIESSSRLSNNSRSYRKLDKRYVSSVHPSKRKVNPEWLKNVEKASYAYHYSGGCGQVFRNGKWEPIKADNNNSQWGNHFNPYSWQEFLKQKNDQSPSNITPKNIIDDKKECDTKGIPCFTCKYRDEKMFLEEEDILEDEVYKCEKCGTIVSGDDDEKVKCPKCNTNEHMTLIEDKDLTDNQVELKELTESIFACSTCGTLLDKKDYDTNCPYCKEVIQYDKNELTEMQLLGDSGAFLDSSYEEANDEALKQLMVDYKPEVKIPDPEKTEIPISELNKPKKESWKDLLMKTFGKGV